jgi:hypothetical protein
MSERCEKKGTRVRVVSEQRQKKDIGWRAQFFFLPISIFLCLARVVDASKVNGSTFIFFFFGADESMEYMEQKKGRRDKFLQNRPPL